MTTPCYDYIIDDGHGWIEVPKSILATLGIEDDITPYSHINGDNVYLEEDLDAWTFGQAAKQQEFEWDYKFRHIDGEADIRNYPPYRPPTRSNPS